MTEHERGCEMDRETSLKSGYEARNISAMSGTAL